MTWKPIKTFKKVAGDFPNKLVMLLVEEAPWKEGEAGHRTPLTDVTPGTKYVTMGHWFPTIDDEPGRWVVVGWNWDNDYFTDDNNAKVVAWQELPKAKM